jgi:biopolymer transport protein ExbD
MNFGPSIRPRTGQDRAIVPMINVVFLLLVFFLMTASLTPPPPAGITPPVAAAPSTDPLPGTLYLAADGTPHFAGVTGPSAMAALAATPPDGALPVMADAAYPAADLARFLPDLAALGIRDIRIVTVLP